MTVSSAYIGKVILQQDVKFKTILAWVHVLLKIMFRVLSSLSKEIWMKSYQLFVYFFLLLGLLCWHTDFIMQRLDFRQLSGWFQLPEKRTLWESNCFISLNVVMICGVRCTTYILIAADFFKCAVLFNEWSAVFLPLRCQVQHPLGAGLHLSLQGGTQMSSTTSGWMDGLNDRSHSSLLPEISPGCCQRLAAGR